MSWPIYAYTSFFLLFLRFYKITVRSSASFKCVIDFKPILDVCLFFVSTPKYELGQVGFVITNFFK